MKKLRYGLYLGGGWLACICLGMAAPAAAQSTPAATTSMPAPMASTYDLIVSFGQTLKKYGIYLQAGYTEDFSANVSGGVKTGIMPIGHGTVGFDLDMETILGIPGGSFHVLIDERNGETIDRIVGTDGPLQADGGPIKYRLGEMYWEQGFNHDQIDITAGRTNPTFDFAFSDISCQFVSSIICAQPGSWYFANNDQAYGTSTWGGRINIAVTPQIYVRVGIYDEDPSQGNFTAAGFDWNTRHSVGVFVPVEVGYQTNFSNAKLPGKYDVGFYDDTSSNTLPNFTAADGTVITGSRRQGRVGGWGQFQQTLWRPDMSTQQSFTVFGGGILYNGQNPYRSQFYVGFLDRAPFVSRQGDTVGFIASRYDIDSAWHPANPQQYQFELNYGASVIPGVIFKPYTQYIVNPFRNGSALGTSPSNAWVVGFQLAISLQQIFQFPQWVPH